MHGDARSRFGHLRRPCEWGKAVVGGAPALIAGQPGFSFCSMGSRHDTAPHEEAMIWLAGEIPPLTIQDIDKSEENSSCTNIAGSAPSNSALKLSAQNL